MRDVADRAGVSVTTVSRALRQSALVSPATTARVLAAAEDLSFAVSRAASGLATGRLGRVGVLVSGRLGSWFNGSVLDGIHAALRDAGQELLIYRITDAEERQRFFATLPARRNTDALIVASFALTPEEHARLQGLAMPVVYLNQRVAGAASVAIDDLAAARTGARHLLDLGHRRLAFVAGPGQAGFVHSAALRVDGFRAELTAAGVPPGDQELLLARAPDDGEHVLTQYLALDPLPTALMVDSDELAMSVLAACWRTGLRAPEDVSVLGFDDHALAAAFGLSTVAQPVDELGRRAAELAVSGLAPRGVGRGAEEVSSDPAATAGPDPAGLQITLPTRLVLRGSTGRAPGGTSPRSPGSPVLDNMKRAVDQRPG